MHEESYANSLEKYVQRNGVYSQNAYLSYSYYKDRDREALDPNYKKKTVFGYRMISTDETY